MPSIFDSLFAPARPTTPESLELRAQSQALLEEADELERKAEQDALDAQAMEICQLRLQKAQERLQAAEDDDAEHDSALAQLAELDATYTRLLTRHAEVSAEIEGAVEAGDDGLIVQGIRERNAVYDSLAIVNEKRTALSAHCEVLAGTQSEDGHAALRAEVKTLTKAARNGRKASKLVAAEIEAKQAAIAKTEAGVEASIYHREQQERELAWKMTKRETAEEQRLRLIAENALANGINLSGQPPAPSLRLHDVAPALV